MFGLLKKKTEIRNEKLLMNKLKSWVYEAITEDKLTRLNNRLKELDDSIPLLDRVSLGKLMDKGFGEVEFQLLLDGDGDSQEINEVMDYIREILQVSGGSKRRRRRRRSKRTKQRKLSKKRKSTKKNKSKRKKTKRRRN
jgi:hypothetical protein